MNISQPPATLTRAWRHAPTVLFAILAGAAHAETKAPATPSPLFHACAGALVDGSTSIRDDDGRRTVTIKLSGPRCKIDFKMEGKVQFNDAFTDLVSLSPGGWFRVDVTDDGERRQLEIAPGRDGLERTWKVNGREQPYDAAASAWLGSFLVELDRRTAIGVDQRLPSLLRKGGASAVLAETAQMPSDYARDVYYSKLTAATKPSNADVARAFDQCASLRTSDY